MAEKRKFIEISESESESELESSDEESILEISSSTSCDDDDDEEEDTYDDESELSGSENEEDDEEFICNNAVQTVRGKSDVQELKLDECKVYLRRYGLRLSGTKNECIERMKEHRRLKDGNGEAFYPRSSFMIDCTGDVCKGDVVLFSQKNSFDKMKRHGSPAGRRTVASRIVKESYGAAKQQHTFTVEVLWSRGTQKLAPLYPLLVKGRNLYKMRTFRQPWKNERERSDVIAEKHQRGAAARTIRAMRKTRSLTMTNKLSMQKAAKRGKHSHHVGPSETKETIHAKNYVNKREKAFAPNRKSNPHQSFNSLQASSTTRDLRGSASHWRHQNPIRENEVREPPYMPYNHPSHSFRHLQSNFDQRGHNHLSYNQGSASVARDPRPPYFHPLPNSAIIYPPYPHLSYLHESANCNHIPRFKDFRASHAAPADTHRWR